MTWQTILAFSIAMAFLSLSPGPGVFTVVGRSLSGGFTQGMVTVFGIVFGDLFYLMLAIVGMTALATTMGDLFMIVKYVGAAYLIWLGVKAWRAPVHPADVQPLKKTNLGRSLVMGFIVTLGNPKAILFYIAFVPTFVDMATLTPGGIAILCAIVATVTVVILGGYAFIAARAARLLRSPKAIRRMNRISGGLLVTAGVAVATR